MKESIVLFSGGIDSTTALYWALDRYDNIFALTFDYGQRNRIELDMARKIAQKLGVPQKILQVDLQQIGGSSLTDTKLALPQYERKEEIEKGASSTYVPFRNGIFLALAAARAEVDGIKEIVCGFNVIDSPNYPDTRKQFVQAMQEAINQGTTASSSPEKIQIIAPFLKMKKSDIIREGLSLSADYSFSISCYSGEEIPCQKCSSCVLRQKAWEEVGLQDPLIIRLEGEGKI
jgi:7-cyano-7-deazaguanine synthase